MKRISIGIVFFLLCTQQSNAQKNTFTISGKITGLDSKKIIYSVRDEKAERGSKIDSIMINNESFTFTAPINEITYVSLWPGIRRTEKSAGSGIYPVKSSTLQFFAFPGANIKFSGKITDFVDAYPSGDEANNDLAKLNKAVYPLMNESINLELKLAKKIITDSTEIKKTRESINKLDEKVINIKQQFIKDHPSSVAAIWLLSDMMLRTQVTNEVAIQLFSKMNKEKLVAVPFYTEVAKRIDGIYATTTGQQAPEINSLNTFNKKQFILSSLKGKYVVIDFWGTWCGPCMQGFPRMKEYWDKYKDKLEMVGVAQESDNGDRWRDFLADNPGYQWHHILSRKDENYILKFNVAGFPTKIIVDPSGKIVGRYVGEDDIIYEKLDELLK